MRILVGLNIADFFFNTMVGGKEKVVEMEKGRIIFIILCSELQSSASKQHPQKCNDLISE